MRVLSLDEIELVAGGSETTVEVWAQDPGDPVYDPGYPDNDPGPAGQGDGGSNGGDTGEPTISSAAAISQVGSELGMDLSNYANHSPSLLHIVTDLANRGWHVKFHAGSSETNYQQQTIYINQDYAGNINMVVPQLAHEYGHVAFQVWDNPNMVSQSQYVADHLLGEGVAALYNASVEHELKATLGIDIGMASYNPLTTTPLYENEYQQYLSNPSSDNYMNVARAMGNTYGAYEHTLQNGVDETYTQHYVDEYNQGRTH